MDVSAVRSDYIKNKLSDGSLQDHRFKNYIQRLMKLESYILQDGPKSFKDGVDFYFLRTTLARDYSSLLLELRPNSHKR